MSLIDSSPMLGIFLLDMHRCNMRCTNFKLKTVNRYTGRKFRVLHSEQKNCFILVDFNIAEFCIVYRHVASVSCCYYCCNWYASQRYDSEHGLIDCNMKCEADV